MMTQVQIFSLVSFFNGISTSVGYLMPSHSPRTLVVLFIWEDKGVHTFPMGICLKVNIIA